MKNNDMRKIYICCPLSGDATRNNDIARFAAREVVKQGDIPIVPHLYFPQFMNVDTPKERNLVLNYGLELLPQCQEVWIINDPITCEMTEVINQAEKLKIPTMTKQIEGQVAMFAIAFGERFILGEFDTTVDALEVCEERCRRVIPDYLDNTVRCLLVIGARSHENPHGWQPWAIKEFNLSELIKK